MANATLCNVGLVVRLQAKETLWEVTAFVDALSGLFPLALTTVAVPGRDRPLFTRLFL